MHRSASAVMLIAACCVVTAPPLTANADALSGPTSAPRVPSSSNPAPHDDTEHGSSDGNGPSDEVVDALVVRSWSACSSVAVLWQQINDTWMDLGETPVHIVFDLRPACDTDVRYQDLVASGADVLILSDTAGGQIDLARHEKKAIRRYTHEGHGLLSTFATFRWETRDRNLSLAPLLGIDAKFAGHTPVAAGPFQELEPDGPLFAGIGDPYLSGGYHHAQVPTDRTWDDADLASSARYAARTADGRGAIIVNEAPDPRSVYISTMPEYYGSVIDAQFIYNAITYVADPDADAELTAAPRSS